MFNKRLAELIDERYSNRKKFAKEFGVPYTTLNNWVSKRKPTQPDYETLNRVADFFSVSVDYLLGRTDNMLLQSGNTVINVSKEIFDLVRELETLNGKQLEAVKNFVAFEKNKKPAE